MNTVIVFIVIVVALALFLLKYKKGAGDGGVAYAKIEHLFSAAERSFLGVLDQALDGQYRVFGKVRLGDLVRPAKGLSDSRRASARNKINQKHVDFVICSASTMTVLGVVELDDKSHERDDRSTRDKFVDLALGDANIPVLHFSAKKAYAIAEVRAKLNSILSTPTADAPPVIDAAPVAAKVTAVAKEPSVVEVADAQVADKPEKPKLCPVLSAEDASVPVCPKCGSAMVKRQAMKGPHAGMFFWACSTFPKCRQVVQVEKA